MANANRIASLPANTAAIPLLWGFAFLSYVTRMNIAVAQQYMARELHFSDIQVGFLFSAFLVGYTVFQIPGGVLGDLFGPRLILGICAMWWAITTLISGMGSAAAGGLTMLLLVRFLHGMGEAPTYPAAMTAVSRWFPLSRHALVTALIFTGSTAGSAFAPPLVANIMYAFGWRAAFYCTAVLPGVLAAAWWWGTRRLIRIDTGIAAAKGATNAAAWFRLLCSGNALALCTSYFLYCYAISIFVYWLFKYLVDVRHLSIVNSGWVNALPWIAATIVVPALGWFSTKLGSKLGALRARRSVAVACLAAAALLMYVGAWAAHIGLAIAAIAASVALLFSTESSYWATSIEIAREEAGASGGLMNLAGNLGGVAATSLVPILVLKASWLVALLSGSLSALLGAVVWFAIRKTEGMN